MEVYWKLASADASVREAASVELVRNLLLQHQQEQPEKKTNKQQDKGLKTHKRKAETKEDADNEDDGLDDYTPSVQYALTRLVRGVASSRECARQGFAMALASLLEGLPSIRIESILNLAKKSLEVTSSMKGQEKRDGLLGQLFALGAIVRAGRLMADAHADGPNLARDMAEQLLTLAKRKVFLREPAITVLLHFLERLPEALHDNVLTSPLLQETLCTELEHASADTFLLALKLRGRLPSSVVKSCPLLPNASGTDALFESSQLLSLIPVLKDSSSCHPRVHPIWNLLTELLFNKVNGHEFSPPPKKQQKKKRQKMDGAEVSKRIEERVSLFWTLVVDTSLLTSSHERKFLAMEVLRLVLPKMLARSAHIVLSKTLVRCLLDILAAKGNLLYKSAQLCLDFIVDWAKPDDEKIVAVIICLQQGSDGKFDTLSKTKMVKQLVGLLRSKEGCSLLFNNLVDIFNGERGTNGTFNDDRHQLQEDERENAGAPVLKAMDIQRSWVVEQIHNCITQVCEPGEAQVCVHKKALKFLTINALFVGPSGAKLYLEELQEGEEFWHPIQPVSDNIRNLCLARLQSLLVNVTPTPTSLNNKKDMKGVEDHTPKTDLRFFFLELCDVLDKAATISRVQPVSADDKGTINALRSSISKLWSLAFKGSTEQRSKMQALSSLLMQLLLQSVTSGVNEIASELVLCCERAFGELMNMDANGGTEQDDGESPAFMDVLVDVLLSLLAQSSAPVRAAAEQVFRAFSNDLMESTLLTLLRVVKKQLKRGRRPVAAGGLLGVDDTDDEDQFLEIEESDEEEVEEVEVNEEKKDNDDDGDANDDEDSGHEKMADGSKGRKHRKKVKETMGGSDHESSKDESESESDMDDEAMFRIDVHLANLLKQRGVGGYKKEAKDAQTQLLHFKFRVLSLLEYFFQKRAGSALCLTALPHLLQALVLSAGAGGNAQLAERIGSVLFRLFKAKEYPKGPEGVDMAGATDLLRRCVRLASRSKVEKVRKVGQSSSLWLAKVLHGGENHELVKVVHDAMNDFFSQKKSKLKGPFFRELFTRFPGLGTACVPLLVDRVTNARSEYLQYEALSLVTSILHLNTGKNSKEFGECLRENLPQLGEVLVGLIEKLPSKAGRKPESRRFCVSLFKAVGKELPSKPMKKAIGKHAYELCVSHFGASAIGGVTALQEGSSGDMVDKTKGKSKKRKSSKQT